VRAPLLPVEPTELDKKAHAFLSEHLDIWRLFCRFTTDLVLAGREHGGAKAIVERIRWECATSAHYADLDFVVNNSHTASLVRIFEATYPERSGFFRTRKRPTERKAA
jgi:hypothetical protein